MVLPAAAASPDLEAAAIAAGYSSYANVRGRQARVAIMQYVIAKNTMMDTQAATVDTSDSCTLLSIVVSRLVDLINLHTAGNAKLDLVKTALDTLATGQTAVKTSVDAVKASVDTGNGKQDTAAAKLDAIATAIGLSNTKLDTLATKEDSAIAKLEAIRALLATMNGRLTTINTAVGTTLHTDLLGVQTRQDTTNTKLGGTVNVKLL